MIAQGGMGAVYEAKDQSLGHSVALKQMLVRGTSLQQQWFGQFDRTRKNDWFL